MGTSSEGFGSKLLLHYSYDSGFETKSKPQHSQKRTAWIRNRKIYRMGNTQKPHLIACGILKMEIQETFSMLDGVILLDAFGDLDEYQEEIDDIFRKTALPMLGLKNIGLKRLNRVLKEAIARNDT